MEKLAAIDLGSNSIRMSIFETDDEKNARLTDSYRSMIKLSEGMTGDMRLQPEAQLRAVSAFLEYKKILAEKGVKNLRAVATAAVRKAKNGDEFVRDVKNATGITIEVIDGETEAALDCLAVSKTLGIQNGIICDIGGGSTEFIALVDGRMQKPPISIPMGSRSITEMFLSDGGSPDSAREAEAYIHKHISELPWLEKMGKAPIIGIGGTLRALAKYHLKDVGGEPILRHEIPAEEIDRLFDEILRATPDRRRKMPGIGEERGDIMLGGLLPFMHLKELTGAPSLIVADVGVREGILFEFLETL